MVRRTRSPATRQQPIFGPPAETARAAFIRFGNALHWEAYLAQSDLVPVVDDRALLEAALARLPRKEHRLVVAFIAELTGGTVTFSEANAVWRETENDTMRIAWNDPVAFLRFLLTVRDRIDPDAWPARTPRFRPDHTGRQSMT